MSGVRWGACFRPSAGRAIAIRADFDLAVVGGTQLVNLVFGVDSARSTAALDSTKPWRYERLSLNAVRWIDKL